MLASLLLWILGAQLGDPVVMSQESDSGKQILHLQAGRWKALTEGKDWHLYPDLQSDGSHAVFVEGEPPNRLVYLNLSSNQRRTWALPEGHTCLQPRLSGDGKRLAFSLTGPDKRAGIAWFDLSQASADKLAPGAPLKLLEIEGDGYFPDLSSDGSVVVFQRNLSGRKEIVRHTLGEKDAEVIGAGNSPSISADDRYLAYARAEADNWNIRRYDLWEKKEQTLTSDPARDLAASFMADGSLVFASDRSGRFQIYHLDPARPGSEKLLHDIPGATYAPRAGGAALKAGALASIPGEARSSFGCAADPDKGQVYLCGGHQGREHSYPPESFSDRLDIYDVASNRWRSGAPRPVKAHGYTLIQSKGSLYAFGGFCYSADHSPRWKSIDTIDSYDIASDRWETVGKLPRARSSNAAIEYDGKVYLFGGWDSTPRGPKDKNGLFHREVDVFDLASGKVIANHTQIPDPLRRAFTAVLAGDEIVLLGGLGASADHFKLIDQVTAYNPKTNQWRELPRLPFATFAPAAGVLGDDIYLFGGMFKTGPQDYRYVNHIFQLPKNGQWSHTGRYLSETKGFSQVAPLPGGKLGILGGHRYLEDGSDQPSATFETLSR